MISDHMFSLTCDYFSNMSGWTIVECPCLASDAGKNALIGQTVLCAHDSEYATGWFMGAVHSRRVTALDRRRAPTANFVVKYTSRVTDGKLIGNVSTELSAAKYGAGEWWVVLQPDGSVWMFACCGTMHTSTCMHQCTFATLESAELACELEYLMGS